MNRLTVMLTFVCVALLALLFSSGPSAKSQSGDKPVQVFFTADLHGYLKPCG